MLLESPSTTGSYLLDGLEIDTFTSRPSLSIELQDNKIQ